MSEKNISAALAPSESVVQFVIAQIVKGLHLNVEVDGETHDGYVYAMDNISPGPQANSLYADVHVPDLDDEPGAEGCFTIKVCIRTDGTVIMLKPEQPPEA